MMVMMMMWLLLFLLLLRMKISRGIVWQVYLDVDTVEWVLHEVTEQI